MDAPSPPLVLGLAGGVASGKSAVARFLASSFDRPGRVLAADAIAQEALDSPEVVARVRERFGPDCLDADGRPDRAAIGAVVFDDPDARKALEGWIHPLVRARILAELEDAGRREVPVVVLDVPLLFENDAQHGLVARCDAILFVESPPEAREARATANRGWSPGEVSRREAAQLPLEEKRSRCDHLVRNGGSLDDLEREVARVLDELRPS